jgi:mannose-6-phosphate isomerase-like protein (cupin superfamily)/SAM-dependent methyltransferase
MQYVYSPPASPSFTDKGLVGYDFGPLRQKNVEIIYIDAERGHDTFLVSKKVARIYYILSGSGHFTIAGGRYEVRPGMIVEVPPRTEFSYSGKMKLIAFSTPRWSGGNDTFTKWNPDVVPWGNIVSKAGDEPWSTQLLRSKIFGKSPLRAYLRVNQRLWNRLPAKVAALGLTRSYGGFLHGLARLDGVRIQDFSTQFFGNRPQFELVRRLAKCKTKDDTLKVAVLGCSTGAEVYSLAWAIRSARPDLKLIMQAMDVSSLAVESARSGAYSLAESQLFRFMTDAESRELFDQKQDVVTIKPWIKEGINWTVGDAAEPDIIDQLGPQDIVLANNFLCHMDDRKAEGCLRNIVRSVGPNGYLFVSGVNLDVRTRVARDLGLNPLQELLDEVHEGDPGTRSRWPFHYAGLEPLNKSKQDWRIRYATAFQRLAASEADCNSSKRPNKTVELTLVS